MSSERLQKLRAGFEQLLEATDAERSSILADLQQTDAAMADELKRMLAAHATRGSVLDRSIPEEIGIRTAYSTRIREGSPIGPYVIKKELGLGGMGVVYLATRTYGNSERRVAIKILRHDRINHLFLSRFQQERQILAQLTHAHIASILDAGETPDGDPYFVMEYVDGSPITAHCRARALGIDAKLHLFLQICDAVQYAHRNLTVHRDLKPGNVLVTEAGAVKLLDFGIARLIEPTQEPFSDAPPTAVILTPEYSSPEQIRREPITTATDVFALGILLYELLSGAHPFSGKGRLPHEVMRAICEDDSVPPSTVAGREAKQIRGDLDTITMTALRKQPHWRYPSVEQLAEDVRRYREGWPILAKGNRRWYRMQKFARRHWRPLAAAMLLVMSLAGGILATSYQTDRANQARGIAERERARAEAERADSERQRALAEQAQQSAVEQRRLAEARTLEAERARQQERQRYRDVRSLASSLLFDLYDGVRDLAGSTTARRLIVSKAQHQLEMLTADGDDDVGLRRDLAASFERMGELRVDPHQPNKNDAAAALEDYRKALRLRREIAAAPDALPRDQRDLALSVSKLGDGQFFAGDSKDAVATYQAAWEIARGLPQLAPADRSMRLALGTVDERRCTVLMTGGTPAEALDACREGISILSALPANAAADDVQVQRTLATTEASYANALRVSQKPQEAVIHATQALASLKRLEVLAPNNAEYRRLSSSAENILANSLAANGKSAESLAAYRRAAHSMQIAMEIDPGDLRSALRLSVTLLSLARRLSAGDDKESAHDTARQALQLLEQTAQQPGAGPLEWNEYADALLKVEWPDLRQPARALQLARDAVSATNRKNPFILDTLAWACYRTGDAQRAAEIEREAISLLPAKATGGLSLELNRSLKTFIAAASPAK